MNDFEKLKELIAGKPKTKSRSSVLKVEGRNVFVVERGQTRVTSLLPGDVSQYKAGDQVLVEGGLVVGRASRIKSKVLYI